MASIEIPVRVERNLQEDVAKAISKKLQGIEAIDSFRIQYGIDTLSITLYADLKHLESGLLVEVHEVIMDCNPLSNRNPE